jgi:hypothetical protein
LTQRCNLIGERAKFLLAASQDNRLGPFSPERERRRTSDSGAGGRDEGGFSGELQVHGSP